MAHLYPSSRTLEYKGFPLTIDKKEVESDADILVIMDSLREQMRLLDTEAFKPAPTLQEFIDGLPNGPIKVDDISIISRIIYFAKILDAVYDMKFVGAETTPPLVDGFNVETKQIPVEHFDFVYSVKNGVHTQDQMFEAVAKYCGIATTGGFRSAVIASVKNEIGVAL